MHAHASADTSVEICGVLVGNWETDGNGPYAVVTNFIRCDNAAQKHAEVTFTQESWTQINHEMDTRYEALRIIGWYHSHPDFGIFLSDRDCFIQEHFFSGPGQVAFVIDPVRHLEGMFEWRNGKPTPMHHYWVGDKVQLGELRPAEKQAPKQAAADDTLPPAPEPPQGRSTEVIMNWIVLVLACLCAFMLGNYLTSSAYRGEMRRHEIETVARYQMFKFMRPGMEQSLEDVHRQLGLVAHDLGVLKQAPIEKIDPKQFAAAMSSLEKVVQQEQDALERVRVVYGHTPEQIAAFNQLFQNYHQPPEKESEAAPKPTAPAKSEAPSATQKRPTLTPTNSESAAPVELMPTPPAPEKPESPAVESTPPATAQ